MRHSLFRLTLQEALRRGATPYDVETLRQKYLIWTGKNAFSTAGEEDFARSVVENETFKFDMIIQEEVKKIPQGLTAYCQKCDHDHVIDETEYRYHTRPLYYAVGFTEIIKRTKDQDEDESVSNNFLDQQVHYTFMGHPIWIHQDLAEVLDRLPGVLEGWAPGLAAKVQKEITDVGGLAIRTVARQNQLSNHAFGLAIDVNANSNPHIVGQMVVAVLNEVAQEGGASFDFGRPLLQKKPEDYTVDDIVEVYSRELPASDAIRDWSRRHLDRYRRKIAQVEAAEKELGLAKVDPMTPLDDRIQRARNAWANLQRQRELRDPNKVSEPLFHEASEPDQGSAPVKDDSAETLALEKFNAAISEIVADRDLARLQVLHESYTDVDRTKYPKQKGYLDS
jgi:hypothetical protein